MRCEDFLEAYESALGTQDWEAVSPLIHEDVCVTFSDGACHIGKAAVKKAFERNFSLIQDEEYRTSAVHWVIRTGNFAVCVYDFQWRGVVDGEDAGGSGRGTIVLVKDEGAWGLIAEQLSPKR